MNIDNFSSYLRLLRVTSWIQRFFANLNKTRDKKSKNLSPILLPEELKLSEQSWTITNQISFNNLQNEQKLNELNAQRNDHGIIRLVGRLNEAPIPYTAEPEILG